MLRPGLVKNGASGISHISGVVVVACLTMGWSSPSYSVEPPQPHLQLAPIRLSHSVGGNLGYMYQRSASDQSMNINQGLTLAVYTRLNASSFIWQPWLARVTSTLGISFINSHASTNTTPTYSSVSTAITGDAVLKLLNTSRFPFKARFYREDSRSDASYAATNTANQRTGYDLSQSYKSISRRLNGAASYTNSKSSPSAGHPSYGDSFNMSLGYRLTRNQTISMIGGSDHYKQPAMGRSSSYDTLVANYAFTPRKSVV